MNRTKVERRMKRSKVAEGMEGKMGMKSLVQPGCGLE